MGKIDATVDKLKLIPIEDVCDSLGLDQKLQQKGHTRSGHCPQCIKTKHGSKSSTYCKIDEERNKLKCFEASCNGSFSTVDLVMIEKGVEFLDACKYLAETFRKDLLDDLVKGEWLHPDDKKKYATSNLYELVYEYGKEQLFKDEGIVAYKYLTEERGIDPAVLLKTEWMYWPKENEIRAYLRSNVPADRLKEVDELSLNGSGGDNFRAALPFRDLFGHISGFIKRHTSKDGIKLTNSDKPKKHDYTAGLKKGDLFGLSRCKRSKQVKQSKQLIILEGAYDATHLHALGIENVAATGQGALSVTHIHGLKALEIESVIIVFDNDKPSEDGTVGAVERAKKASDLLEENGIATFFIPREFLKNAKDPEEFITRKEQGYGFEEFKNIIKTPLSRAHWLPYYLTYKGELETDLGAYGALSNAAKEYIKLEPYERKPFKAAMSKFFKLDPEEFEGRLEKALKRNQEEAAAALKKQIEQKASELLLKGERDKALELLDDLEIKENKSSFSEIPPYTLENLKTDLKLSKEGLRTGYEALDKYVTIQNQAITLIGGRPSHGKTTFMLNLFVNLIKQNPKKNFYFFSYEETCQQIALKLINILGGHIFNEAKNLLQLEGYIKSGTTSEAAVEEAKTLYQELVTSGRLRIIGHSYFASDLASQIAFLCKEEPVGGVFVDYIQKIKNKGRFGTRQLELQNTSEIILETAKSCSIPIILGAQLGRDKDSKDKVKLDNLREAGDLEQDANLVLGLFNPSMEKAHEDGSQVVERCVKITVTPLKNRNGPVNIKVPLEFDRPLLTIQDDNAFEKKKASEALRNKRKDDEAWKL